MVQLLLNILGTNAAAAAEYPYNSVIPLLLLVIIQSCDETAAAIAGEYPYNSVMQLLVLLLLNVLTIL